MDATISQLANQLIAQVANIIDPETALDTRDILYLSQSLEVLSRLTEPTGTPASVPTHAPVPVDSTEGLVKIGSYQYQVQVFPDKVDFHRVVKGTEVLVETLNLRTNICSCKYGKQDCAHKRWLEVNPQVLETVATGDEDEKVTPTDAPIEVDELIELQKIVDATPDEKLQEWIDEHNNRPLSADEIQAFIEDTQVITDDQINDITETTPGVTIVTEEVTPELMAEYLEDINGMPPTPVKTASITAMIASEVQSGTHPVAVGLAGYLPGSTGEVGGPPVRSRMAPDDAIEVESVEVTEAEPDETSDDEEIQMMTFDNFMALKRVKPLFGQRLAVTRGDSTGFYLIERKTFSVGVVEEMAQYSWQVIGDLKQMVSSHLDELDESNPVSEFDATPENETPLVDTTKTHPDPVWDTDEDGDGFPVVELTHEDYANRTPTPTFEQVVRTTLEGRALRMGVPNPEDYSTQDLAKLIKGDLIIGTPDEVPQSDSTPLDVPEIELVSDSEPDADPFGDFDF